MEDLKYWVWLSKIEGLGSIKTQRLLEKYCNPKEIWKLKKEDLVKVEGIGIKIAEEILDEKYRCGLEKEVEYMKENNIELISIQDKDYPEKLKTLYDKPISLYIRGNKELLNEFSLAIIGCRENSNYGNEVARAVTKGVARKNIITVSGLAKGIDSICHKETLLAGGKTIAVIGSGLDIIYPYENNNLAQEIIKKGGTIVTEYPIKTKPQKMNFPARNRIISGLSDGIIVIEAKKKSGTMSTVDFALDQGKNIFAIPRQYN